MSLRGHRLLYDPAHEHDACGVGFVADVSGHRSHRILEQAVESVVNLTDRGAGEAVTLNLFRPRSNRLSRYI